MRSLSLVLALLVHLVLLLPLVLGFDEKVLPPLPTPPELLSVQLLPRSADDTFMRGDAPGTFGSPDPEICRRAGQYYEGVGIISTFGTNIVTSAPAEYPAYRLGIRVGDTIMEFYKIPGVKTMYAKVHRSGVSDPLEFMIPIEKICFSGNN